VPVSKPVKRRILTTDLVVNRAMEVADAEGLQAITLRRLAIELGVTPMAVYRHVRDKSHLFDLMADRLLDELDQGTRPAAGSGAEPWSERLRALLNSYQSVLAAHPATPQLVTRPFVSTAGLRVSESLLDILASAGFSPDEAVQLLQAITPLVLGPALHRSGWGKSSPDLVLDTTRMQESMMGVTAADYPNVAALVDRMLDWSDSTAIDRMTVDILVAGVEALAARRRAERPS
jgi:TetR/AcrR family tetracycline transcriptional repressor